MRNAKIVMENINNSFIEINTLGRRYNEPTHTMALVYGKRECFSKLYYLINCYHYQQSTGDQEIDIFSKVSNFPSLNKKLIEEELNSDHLLISSVCREALRNISDRLNPRKKFSVRINKILNLFIR
jgi:hypothetical protein